MFNPQRLSLRNLLLLAFTLQVVISLIIRYFSYVGNLDSVVEQQILNYFSPEDILNGAEYHRAGFFAGLASKVIALILTFLFVFTPLSQKIENSLPLCDGLVSLHGLDILHFHNR